MVLLLTSGIASMVSLLTFRAASTVLLLTLVLTCADILGLHWGRIEMRKTDCFGETRLVAHAPSSS